MIYSGFNGLVCGEGGNITYIIITNHVLSKYSDSKVFIKNR